MRSFVDPLGEFPPGESVSIVTRRGWFGRVSKLLKATERVYLGRTRDDAPVTRLDLILKHDPFSVEALQTVQRVETELDRVRETADWRDVEFSFAGMPAGLRDLRSVTQRDSARIKILVLSTVFAVLLVVLRRPVLCAYLVASVLFSYFVTIGLTQWLFAWALGPEHYGLDWKTPLFVFVILVAVGQDYNVYLTTRVIEEQRQLGLLDGLRVAVVRTGGIITSCGLIMAAAFITMTSGAWPPILQFWNPDWFSWLGESRPLTSLLQLGFALSCGILLDTFVVRPVLAPAFLAWQAAHAGPSAGLPESAQGDSNTKER